MIFLRRFAQTARKFSTRPAAPSPTLYRVVHDVFLGSWGPTWVLLGNPITRWTREIVQHDANLQPRESQAAKKCAELHDREGGSDREDDAWYRRTRREGDTSHGSGSNIGTTVRGLGTVQRTHCLGSFVEESRTRERESGTGGDASNSGCALVFLRRGPHAGEYSAARRALLALVFVGTELHTHLRHKCRGNDVRTLGRFHRSGCSFLGGSRERAKGLRPADRDRTSS